MKFKSEEEHIVNEEPEKISGDECVMGQMIDIAISQITLLNTLLSSLNSTVESIKDLYEEHNSR